MSESPKSELPKSEPPKSVPPLIDICSIYIRNNNKLFKELINTINIRNYNFQYLTDINNSIKNCCINDNLYVFKKILKYFNLDLFKTDYFELIFKNNSINIYNFIIDNKIIDSKIYSFKRIEYKYNFKNICNTENIYKYEYLEYYIINCTEDKLKIIFTQISNYSILEYITNKNFEKLQKLFLNKDIRIVFDLIKKNKVDEKDIDNALNNIITRIDYFSDYLIKIISPIFIEFNKEVYISNYFNDYLNNDYINTDLIFNILKLNIKFDNSLIDNNRLKKSIEYINNKIYEEYIIDYIKYLNKHNIKCELSLEEKNKFILKNFNKINKFIIDYFDIRLINQEIKRCEFEKLTKFNISFTDNVIFDQIDKYDGSYLVKYLDDVINTKELLIKSINNNFIEGINYVAKLNNNGQFRLDYINTDNLNNNLKFYLLKNNLILFNSNLFKEKEIFDIINKIEDEYEIEIILVYILLFYNKNYFIIKKKNIIFEKNADKVFKLPNKLYKKYKFLIEKFNNSYEQLSIVDLY